MKIIILRVIFLLCLLRSIAISANMSEFSQVRTPLALVVRATMQLISDIDELSMPANPQNKELISMYILGKLFYIQYQLKRMNQHNNDDRSYMVSYLERYKTNIRSLVDTMYHAELEYLLRECK